MPPQRHESPAPPSPPPDEPGPLRYHRRVHNLAASVRLVALTSIAALIGAAAGDADAGPIADPAPWVLPVNALAKAKVGDWTLLEGDAVIAGQSVHEREIVRVAAITGGVAELQLFEGAAGHESWFLSFPVELKRGPDTNLFFDLPWIARDLRQHKASCTLGAATFPCTQVSYRTATHAVTALMAPRVRGSGIVSFEVVPTGATAPSWSMKTIGYGTADKVEWGAGPPRADLQGNWDGGAAATVMREGTVPAAADVYEPVPLGTAPRVDLDNCTVVGDLELNVVRRYVLRKLRPIEDRYITALAAQPKLGGGAVDVTFTVDETDAIIDLAAAGSAAAPLQACVSDNVAAVRFPHPDSGGPSTVTCTFTFDPGTPPPKRHGKPKLLTRGHPARGGHDIRGAQRVP